MSLDMYKPCILSNILGEEGANRNSRNNFTKTFSTPKSCGTPVNANQIVHENALDLILTDCNHIIIQE